MKIITSYPARAEPVQFPRCDCGAILIGFHPELMWVGGSGYQAVYTCPDCMGERESEFQGVMFDISILTTE